MISDGDLQAAASSSATAIEALDHTAAQIMKPTPVTIHGSAFAADAPAIMEAKKKITSLVVVDPDGHVQGVLHLHDLWTR